MGKNTDWKSQGILSVRKSGNHEFLYGDGTSERNSVYIKGCPVHKVTLLVNWVPLATSNLICENVLVGSGIRCSRTFLILMSIS